MRAVTKSQEKKIQTQIRKRGGRVAAIKRGLSENIINVGLVVLYETTGPGGVTICGRAGQDVPYAGATDDDDVWAAGLGQERVAAGRLRLAGRLRSERAGERERVSAAVALTNGRRRRRRRRRCLDRASADGTPTVVER